MLFMQPNISILDFIKIFIQRETVPSDHELALPWLKAGYHPVWFSRSAWSLTAIAMWRQAFFDVPRINFWVPDYFCEQTLQYIRTTGVQLVFYPVTAARIPDWEGCNVLALEQKPHLFLFPHYFGREMDVVQIRNFCHKHKALFIEDCAHVLLPTKSIGKTGDFVIYSQHKHLSIPDGALLLVRPTLMRILEKDSQNFLDSFKKVYQQLPQRSAPVSSWVIKRIIQKCLPVLITILHSYKRRNANSQAFASIVAPKQSYLSRKLLAQQLSRIEAYAWHRKYNAAVFSDLYERNQNEEIIYSELRQDFPYMLELKLHETKVLSLINRAKKIGARLSTWPDIAPEVLQFPENYSCAIDLYKSRVFFPIHHDISIEKLLYKFNKKVIAKTYEPDDSLKIKWEFPLDEWDNCFLQAPKSCLVQSRLYVNVLCEIKHCTPIFGAIIKQNDIIAIFTMIEKHGPFGAAIARLNHGPTWLKENFDDSIMMGALSLLARKYKAKYGRVLLISPNISMRDSALSVMHALGFHRRLLRPWASIWIDLNLSENELLTRLEGKWRNQLLSAQKKGLQFEYSQEEEKFEWLLTQYTEFKKQRKFSGPQSDLIRLLREKMSCTKEKIFILIAKVKENDVAGVIVVQHGSSATYLVGYVNEEGRRFNASNFLLWNAMLLLKNRRCYWFDLGGVDEYLTPGVAEFKRGLRGEEYRFIGEYIHW